MNHFKGKQFQQDVIIVAVGYYLRYHLSYREVQEYTKRTEEMERSSDFRYPRKSKY